MSELADGVVALDSDPQFGGMTSVRATTRAGELVVLPHGAHVCHWQPAGHDPVLWMSSSSQFADDKAVRGGVPICFPWFGPGRSGDLSPAHGWARLVDWQLVTTDVDDVGAATLVFALDSDDVAGRPGAAELGDFRLSYTVTAGADLTLALTVTAGSVPLDVEAALHTYLRVADITSTTIDGLDAVTYFDKVTGQWAQVSGPVGFSGETDRVYESAGPVTVHADRTFRVHTNGAAQTVVWNPWIDKAAAMPDFGDDEWTGMVCVEAASVLDRPIVLAPGGSHSMVATYSVTKGPSLD